MASTINNIIQFEPPAQLLCPQPTEQRQLQRDEARLLVTNGAGQIYHDKFQNFDRYLAPGSVLVVNTSATLPAAFPLKLPDGQPGMLHLSTRFAALEWLIEIRSIEKHKTTRWQGGMAGMRFSLPGNVEIVLKERFYKDRSLLHLWLATLHLDEDPISYMNKYGQPIKYVRPDQPYPLSYYQTAFSFQPGSSEMPSAGRGFTEPLLQKLIRRGVRIVPILLHTGVSSLEEDEKPYPEYLEIDPLSALQLNTAKEDGRRVIAVGTTAVRAIESATNDEGRVEAFRGYTNLFIDETYRMQIVNGLLTGFHEPRASHLHMLQSLAGEEHIGRAYDAAIAGQYYWHEFGDLHLIL